MDAALIIERLRRFLLALAGCLCIGTTIELVLAEHTEDHIQLVPFVLCALGLIAVLMTLIRPQRLTLLALRGVMGLLILGSLFGIYEHLQSNIAFELDIRPGAVVFDVLFEALKGAAPLLAPGILALAGVLAIAATYYHPGLSSDLPVA
jgi:hypothetical protein